MHFLSWPLWRAVVGTIIDRSCNSIPDLPSDAWAAEDTPFRSITAVWVCSTTLQPALLLHFHTLSLESGKSHFILPCKNHYDTHKLCSKVSIFSYTELIRLDFFWPASTVIMVCVTVNNQNYLINNCTNHRHIQTQWQNRSPSCEPTMSKLIPLICAANQDKANFSKEPFLGHRHIVSMEWLSRTQGKSELKNILTQVQKGQLITHSTSSNELSSSCSLWRSIYWGSRLEKEH